MVQNRSKKQIKCSNFLVYETKKSFSYDAFVVVVAAAIFLSSATFFYFNEIWNFFNYVPRMNLNFAYDFTLCRKAKQN